MTFSCWFRDDNSGNYARLFEIGNGEQADNVYLAVLTGDLDVTVWLGSTPDEVISIPITENTWRHVAWTLGTDNTWILYFNGVIVWTKTGRSYPNAIIRTKNYIGKSDFASDAYFNGAIDDFRYYNRLLSPSEVLNIYTSTLNPSLCIAGIG